MSLSATIPSTKFSIFVDARNCIIIVFAQSVYLHVCAGTLPSAWGTPGALPALAWLFLNNTRMTGNLPLSWSAPGALSSLTRLYLQNTLVTGSLPPSWATQDAFQSLDLLYLFNSRITGSLPLSWAKKGAFPKLTDLSLQNTLMTGSLPPSWGRGFLALETLALGPSQQNGTLPAEWGSPGSFPQLTFLQINGSNITGLWHQTLHHCKCCTHVHGPFFLVWWEGLQGVWGLEVSANLNVENWLQRDAQPL